MTDYTLYFQCGHAVNAADRRHETDMEGYVSEAYAAEFDDNPYLRLSSQRPALRCRHASYGGG